MKKIRFLIVLGISTLFLTFTACTKNCIGDPPKDLKPIDWNNYNDAYTVYWNYVTKFSKRNIEDEGKIIKVSGWEVWSLDLFALSDDPKYTEHILGNTPREVVWVQFRDPEIQAMLDTADLTKKCFVKGKLSFVDVGSGVCRKAEPQVIVTNINDIYFD